MGIVGSIGCTHTICVKTGDKKGAGTNGNVFFILMDEKGNQCEELCVDARWNDDFEKGNEDYFMFKLPGLEKISEITIRRDEKKPDDHWYVERVEIAHKHTKEKSVFPVHRWIGANHSMVLTEHDCVLPQDDKYPEQRSAELAKKREMYEYEDPGKTPRRVKNFPADQSFSNDAQWDLAKLGLELITKITVTGWITGDLDSLADFEELYKFEALNIPESMDEWKSDEAFAYRKVMGCNPKVIELCRKIPSHMLVNQRMLEPYLERERLDTMIRKKKIYMCDYRYLEDIKCAEGKKVPGATCLFYIRKDSVMVPIAIQLHPKPSKDNPIFLPNDGFAWLFAKMWFNMADGSHHQSVSHLGFTHILMESFAVSTHRQLSPSHPIFRVLAPHFIYLFAINNLALKQLVNEGGWVDKCYAIGKDGMLDAIHYHWERWNFKDHAVLKNDLKRRGVDDTEALPYYPYRDDALLLWDAMEKYVRNIVNAYYDNERKIREDPELQAWVKELREDANFKGLPTSFNTTEEITEFVTAFMFIGSVEHASVNFGQYDQYGFIPALPGQLKGEPPKSKGQLTEEDVVKCLPEKSAVLDTLIITKLLSNLSTNTLGNYEVTYATEPKTVKALEQFKADLKEIGNIINQRNEEREKKGQKRYSSLHPDVVPNAISI